MSKLVRDKIPLHINARGEDAVIEKIDKMEADGREYYLNLVAKLDEEVEEFKRAPTIEELADIAEVLRALSWHIGYTPSQLETVREGKEVSRGGFFEGIRLLDEDDHPLPKVCCCSAWLRSSGDTAPAGYPCMACSCCDDRIMPQECPNE